MNKKPNFSHSFDRALFTYVVLRQLGAGSVESFEQRFRSQKIQYFAQLFRVSPPYPFNLYIRGPYSPALADDLFQIREHRVRIAKIDKFPSRELETRFLGLKKFIRGKNNRELELIATLDWLLREAKVSSMVAKKKLDTLKGASPSEINFTFNWVQHLCREI